MSQSQEALLTGTLALAVPLWIECYRGESSEFIEAKVRECQEVLAESSEYVLHRSKKRGESAAAFNALAKAIACLSFVPGGVTCFGSHWESKLDGASA